MLERQLYENYRIDLEDAMYIGEDLVIRSNGSQYLLRFGSDYNQAKLNEQTRMVERLVARGDQQIMTPLKTLNGTELTAIDGQDVVAFIIPEPSLTFNNQMGRSMGKRLAYFHLMGEDYEPVHFQGQGPWFVWQERWIKRLDQLEQWYVKKQQDRYKNKLDEQFLLSFPYFLGMTENAIQVMTDLRINFPYSIRDGRGNTICHYRFHEGSWVTLEQGHVSVFKVPTDFFYDHFTRDVAEYIRNICISAIPLKRKLIRIERFLQRYHAIRPFNELDINLLIARLVFPVQYFELIEEYYRIIDEQRKVFLENEIYFLFEKANEYERLIEFVSRLFYKEQTNSLLPKWIFDKQFFKY